MSLITRNPTSNTSPDPGVPGSVAVTGASNTGHASTTATGDGSGSLAEQKTCLWTGFASVGGQISSVTLKIDHTSSGTLSGASAQNNFTLEYSLNGGSSWTTAVQRLNFTASQGPTTFSVALSAAQDLTRVQVRDSIFARATDPGDTATCVATIANIKIEVAVIDPQLIVMM